MQALPPAIEVYPVHHLPIIKAYAGQLGLVSLINGFDHGVGHPLLLLCDAKAPNYRKNKAFKDLDSVIKFFVLDGLSSGVVAVSPDSAPDSAFAPSLFARPSGPLPSPIIRCPAGLARLKSSLMPSGRAHSQWPGDPDGHWQASPLCQGLC